MTLYYAYGLLATNSILLLWFFSPLASSIGKFFLKRNDIYITEDLIDIISLKSHFLATLLSCWICLSFWMSLLVGFLLMIFFNLHWQFPLITFSSYPPILYIIKQLYR